MTAEAAPSLRTTREVEAYYEYAASMKEVHENIREGKPPHRRIYKSDDARWDEEMMQPPFNGQVAGFLNVAEVTRVFSDEHPEGEIVKQRGIFGGVMHKNKAQDFLRQFEELKAQGSKTPWDQERHFRDSKEAADKARLEHNDAELVRLTQAIKEALSGPSTLAPVTTVSHGSPVTKAGTAEKEKSK